MRHVPVHQLRLDGYYSRWDIYEDIFEPSGLNFCPDIKQINPQIKSVADLTNEAEATNYGVEWGLLYYQE